MTTHTSTATIDCGKCHVPLKGPTNPNPNDILHCPKCGGEIKTEEAVKQARKLVVSSVKKQLKDAFRKAEFK